MSRLENLSKDDWIIITEVVTVSHPTTMPGLYAESYPYSCNGIPLRVLGISAPWIAVTDSRYTGTIDSRYVSWTKATKEYLQALKSVKIGNEVENFKNLWYIPESAKAEKVCPNCGNKLIERKDLITDWELYCKNCHFKGAVHD